MSRSTKSRSIANPNRDATRIFHRKWLGLAQPIEGLVFSVPALDEAPAPAERAEITAAIRSVLLEEDDTWSMRSAEDFFRRFLGYDAEGMLIPRSALPPDLTFYAPESRQEIRPTFAIARGPLSASATDDPFAEFSTSPAPDDEDSLSRSRERAGVREPQPPPDAISPPPPPQSPYLALVWDLQQDTPAPSTPVDLDSPEDLTGPWRYPPTAKLERLLRHLSIPIGFLTNRRHLRVVYAPAGEATSHLTFRLEDLADPAGRPLALALELLFHARRTYTSAPQHTFEGLLAESRRRQADVTEALAQQVFQAVERLLEGVESAAARDITGDRPDYLRAAMEASQVYEGVLNVVLRLVFLLYAEDRSLLPVAHPTYAAHLSVLGLYERLSADAGSHPESMHQRYGGYGALVSLFRAVYFGVHHGDLHLPPRQGRLFDPSAFPFLEGGLPEDTAAVSLPSDRAAVRLPTIDDGTLHEVLEDLVILDGQRISYRDLSVEQIGAVYESLMGFAVERMEGASVRLGKSGYWVSAHTLRSASKQEREKILDERCDLSKAAMKHAHEALKEAADDDALADLLVEKCVGKSERGRHRARAGQLVLQPTASRRSTGSHYTPRSLSEKVVRRTLEPILACLGEAPTAGQILELKVCDPAMGSGAFLVEACRFLGDAVVEAWRRSGDLPAAIEKHGDALLHAKRMVAQRCLYGVDKNAAAVELAKLSLWLETLSGEKPFTFLDHVLRHGDSLVGLDVAQVRAFHWAPEAQSETVAVLVDQALAEVRENREAIQRIAEDESEEGEREKRRLLEIAELAMGRVKLVADVCVGAFFSEGKKAGREKERDRRLGVVEKYLGGDEGEKAQLEEWAGVIRRQHAPFHWHLELPEVFFLERPDPLAKGDVNKAAFVDAFVGNPPFMGGNLITKTISDSYSQWLAQIHGGDASADLSGRFFTRAASWLGAHGTIGFVTTTSIYEGETRRASLQFLMASGSIIYDATRSFDWPGDASVTAAVVHLARGAPASNCAPLTLDGRPVARINSRLLDDPERPDPADLRANAGFSYTGVMLHGEGFLLEPEEYNRLVQNDARTADVVFPYMAGEDLTQVVAVEPFRYVINFKDRTLEDAATFGAVFEMVRTRVKPGRDKDNRDQRRRLWWRLGEPAHGMTVASKPLDRVVVVTKFAVHGCFTFLPTSFVPSQSLCVIPLRNATALAVLQSRIHLTWSAYLSGTRKQHFRYTPSEAFLTFPFPSADLRAVIAVPEHIGERLYEARAAYMRTHERCLTDLYNLLKDPACHDEPVVTLRRLHEEMDRAVLDAYGWTDIPVPPFCPTTAAEQKAVETFQDQVIDHLFVLNAERASEEARHGTSAKTVSQNPRVAKRAPKRSTSGQGDLF